MFKTIIWGVIILSLFTLISILIPDSITSSIDSAFIYFLNFLWNLNLIVNVATIFTCLQILFNFYIGVAIFWIFHWILITLK